MEMVWALKHRGPFMVDVPQETTQGWQEQHFDEDMDTGK